MKYKRLPLILYLCLLPTLLALGVWQLNRAEEKRLSLKIQDQRRTEQTLELSPNTPNNIEPLLYKHVQVNGHFDGSRQFLLDNQISKGKVGYLVLTLFILKGSDRGVLVNRGWVPLGKDRSVIPDISIDNNEKVVTGHINHFPSVGIKLAGAEIPTKNWPALIQVVDTNVLSNQLGYSLFSFQVELDKEVANGFRREWHTVSAMPPEKHTGYAVQWFLLALTLTVLFFKYGIKKHHE